MSNLVSLVKIICTKNYTTACRIEFNTKRILYPNQKIKEDMIVIDYFSKWVEDMTLAPTTKFQVVNFINTRIGAPSPNNILRGRWSIEETNSHNRTKSINYPPYKVVVIAYPNTYVLENGKGKKLKNISNAEYLK